jgi:hypothetical protein
MDCPIGKEPRFGAVATEAQCYLVGTQAKVPAPDFYVAASHINVEDWKGLPNLRRHTVSHGPQLFGGSSAPVSELHTFVAGDLSQHTFEFICPRCVGQTELNLEKRSFTLPATGNCCCE